VLIKSLVLGSYQYWRAGQSVGRTRAVRESVIAVEVEHVLSFSSLSCRKNAYVGSVLH
jgi:hypothetical protein